MKIPYFSHILKPELYHGRIMHPPFFEGWYFKVVDAARMQRFAFIPGIFLGISGEDSHAFVQVLDGSTGQVVYHRYPVEEFQAATDKFLLSVGPNRFSLDTIQLNLSSPEQTVQGEFHFDTPISWPVSVISPGVMGWFAWVPHMECYHGVLGFDHAVQGSIQLNGEPLDFNGGRGYIEKDWGHAFPQAWVWMQSNHFETPHTSLTASVAVIPWLGNVFAGFIVGLWRDGRLHRFATYNNSHILLLEVNNQQVRWQMRNRTHRLEIEASGSKGGLLMAPTPQGMGRRISETLNAAIRVRLFDDKSDSVEFEGTGQMAGLEVVGDMEKLLAMVKK